MDDREEQEWREILKNDPSSVKTSEKPAQYQSAQINRRPVQVKPNHATLKKKQVLPKPLPVYSTSPATPKPLLLATPITMTNNHSTVAASAHDLDSSSNLLVVQSSERSGKELWQIVKSNYSKILSMRGFKDQELIKIMQGYSEPSSDWKHRLKRHQTRGVPLYFAVRYLRAACLMLIYLVIPFQYSFF